MYFKSSRLTYLLPFILSSFLFLNCSDKKKSNEVDKTIHKIPKDTLQNTTTIKETQEKLDNNIAETNTETLRYHIIAGSFKNESNAKKTLKMLPSVFTKTTIIKNHKNDNYLVSLNSFTDEHKAYNFYEKYSYLFDLDIELWIYKNQ